MGNVHASGKKGGYGKYGNGHVEGVLHERDVEMSSETSHTYHKAPLWGRDCNMAYDSSAASTGLSTRAGMGIMHQVAMDTLGRAEVQVLESSVRTQLPNILGDAHNDLQRHMASDAAWMQDINPVPTMTRSNQYDTLDIRGAPPAPHNNMSQVPVSLQFAAPEEWFNPRFADAVVPHSIPMLHK